MTQQETLEEPAEWLNKKFNGKGVEVKIIDWGNNKIYNYPPKKLLEEYSKWQQERMFSYEEVKELLIKYLHYLTIDNDIEADEWLKRYNKLKLDV